MLFEPCLMHVKNWVFYAYHFDLNKLLADKYQEGPMENFHQRFWGTKIYIEGAKPFSSFSRPPSPDMHGTWLRFIPIRPNRTNCDCRSQQSICVFFWNFNHNSLLKKLKTDIKFWKNWLGTFRVLKGYKGS